MQHHLIILRSLVATTQRTAQLQLLAQLQLPALPLERHHAGICCKVAKRQQIVFILRSGDQNVPIICILGVLVRACCLSVLVSF